jgi:ribosomal protein S18 acetylase RimI-like enzyme
MAADHMDIKYNRASLDDINELVRLRLAYLAADFGELSAKDASNIAESLPAYFERHLDRDLYAHVAWANGKMVGTCWLLLSEKPMSVAFPRGKTAAIFNVYVDPSYRRRGIARQLMLNLIGQARQRGLARLELRATAMGFELYKSIGFVEDSPTHRAMNYVLFDR